MPVNLETDLMWVVIEDGRMYMHDPNGNRIVGEMFCRVTDHANKHPKVFFQAIVNIAGSVDEMNEKIKKGKEANEGGNTL